MVATVVVVIVLVVVAVVVIVVRVITCCLAAYCCYYYYYCSFAYCLATVLRLFPLTSIDCSSSIDKAGDIYGA